MDLAILYLVYCAGFSWMLDVVHNHRLKLPTFCILHLPTDLAILHAHETLNIAKHKSETMPITN